MTQCVELVSGYVVASASDPCTMQVVPDAAEYAAVVAYVSAAASAPGVYDIPPTADLASAFSWGLTGVLSSYLVAWACARVLDQIRDRKY